VTDPTRWRFEPADTALHLRQASDELDAILLVRGVSERTRYAARLAAEELVLNAFEHGGARTVWMELNQAGDPHRLIFEDDGAPFDPTATLSSPGWDTTRGASQRGNGLVLLRGFTRTIEHYLADGHNHLSVLLVE
jgi:anti-sigma regulatory factor (Ser/Thr protein kinase)